MENSAKGWGGAYGNQSAFQAAEENGYPRKKILSIIEKEIELLNQGFKAASENVEITEVVVK